MVTLKNIFFENEGFLILKNISIFIKCKKTGIIGDNGSGKSSLLRMIKKLEKPSSGILNIDLTSSLIFQNPDHQILCPTVKDELCFGLLEMGFTKEIVEKKLNQMLIKFQGEFLVDKATHELSEGEKQFVCILSALMDDAEIILLDEPFSSLDLKNQKKFTNMILKLPQPIIMASHQLDLLKDFDEIIWLANGEIENIGPPHKILSLYKKSIGDCE